MELVLNIGMAQSLQKSKLYYQIVKLHYQTAQAVLDVINYCY